MTADGYIPATAHFPVFVDPHAATGSRRPSFDATPFRPYSDIHLGGSLKSACPYEDHY
jgi:hypothetical protein